MVYIFLILLLVFIDQLSKYGFLHLLGEYGQLQLTPFLNIAMTYNKGAAWSFLADSDYGIYLLTALSAIFLLLLAWWWYKHYREFNGYVNTCLSLIAAGGAANLADRILLGKVIDFIDFHWSTYHFPTFNVADSCLTVAMFLLIIFVLSGHIDLQELLKSFDKNEHEAEHA